MSQLQISRSADLSRLRAEGYNVSVEGGHLVMRDVPYVTPSKQVGRCIIADPYNDASGRPNDHTMWVSGEALCNEHGQVLSRYLADAGMHNQQIIESAPSNLKSTGMRLR